ncbi:hypothetical protein [Halobacillus faecis]
MAQPSRVRFQTNERPRQWKDIHPFNKDEKVLKEGAGEKTDLRMAGRGEVSVRQSPQ